MEIYSCLFKREDGSKFIALASQSFINRNKGTQIKKYGNAVLESASLHNIIPDPITSLELLGVGIKYVEEFK